MLGRTLADGHQHAVNWQAERLDRTVAYIRAQAGARWPLELNALVQGDVAALAPVIDRLRASRR